MYVSYRQNNTLLFNILLAILLYRNFREEVPLLLIPEKGVQIVIVVNDVIVAATIFVSLLGMPFCHVLMCCMTKLTKQKVNNFCFE